MPPLVRPSPGAAFRGSGPMDRMRASRLPAAPIGAAPRRREAEGSREEAGRRARDPRPGEAEGPEAGRLRQLQAPAGGGEAQPLPAGARQVGQEAEGRPAGEGVGRGPDHLARDGLDRPLPGGRTGHPAGQVDPVSPAQEGEQGLGSAPLLPTVLPSRRAQPDDTRLAHDPCPVPVHHQGRVLVHAEAPAPALPGRHGHEEATQPAPGQKVLVDDPAPEDPEAPPEPDALTLLGGADAVRQRPGAGALRDHGVSQDGGPRAAARHHRSLPEALADRAQGPGFPPTRQ